MSHQRQQTIGEEVRDLLLHILIGVGLVVGIIVWVFYVPKRVCAHRGNGWNSDLNPGIARLYDSSKSKILAEDDVLGFLCRGVWRAGSLGCSCFGKSRSSRANWFALTAFVELVITYLLDGARMPRKTSPNVRPAPGSDQSDGNVVSCLLRIGRQ